MSEPSEASDHNRTPERKYCGAMCLVPFFYKGATQYPCCIRELDHAGAHLSSVAYGSKEWAATATSPQFPNPR